VTAIASETHNWQPQPEARAFIDSLAERFLYACPRARDLADRMAAETGTRFADWVDHIETPDAADRDTAERLGFVERPSLLTDEGLPALVNERGLLPPVIVGASKLRVAIKVDSVSDFFATWQLSGARVQGRPLSQLRTGTAFVAGDAELLVVERHGALGFGSISIDANLALRSMSHYERLRCRRRDWDDIGVGFADLRRLVESAVAELGQDLTCDLFFRTEREFWMRRNAAGRAQKAAQDRLGLGWANHDHHVYRSSRSCFTDLIGVLEAMGLRCRESFMSSENTGVQALEHPVTGIVVLAEVDMNAEELAGNFAHHGLRDRTPEPGKVGRWCAAHGQAVLNAGMYRLACRAAESSLTDAEPWAAGGQDLPGSHLQRITRVDGFKGFGA